MAPIVAFVNKHAELVVVERDIDLGQMIELLSTKSTAQLEDMGYSLCNLRIAQRSGTSNNATLVTLEPTRCQELPWTILRTGDIVKLDKPANDHIVRKYDIESPDVISGTISSISNKKLVIYLSSEDKIPWEWNERCSITRIVFDVPYKRILIALADLSNHSNVRPLLHYVAFSSVSPTFQSTTSPIEQGYINMSLDVFQKDAVRLAVTADNIALIHGPPGTGKTQTIVEIVWQLLRQDKRILLCGPSNISVDNMVERLGSSDPSISMVRIGSPARMLPSVEKYSLHYLAGGATNDPPCTDPHLAMSAQYLGSVDDLALQMSGLGAGYGCYGVSRRQDSRKYSTDSEIIQSKRLILSTLCSAGGRELDGNIGVIDVVIIDEATQAIEGDCWIAALKAPKLILAGDHHQLQPTVKSVNDSNAKGKDSKQLLLSLFERMRNKHGEAICRTLYRQYRMHNDIMRVSSDALYGGKLEAHTSVASHVLCDLEHVAYTADTCASLVLIDTAGYGLTEAAEGSGEAGNTDSKANYGEAKLARHHIDLLVSAGLEPKDIAVISPYSAQVRLLRRQLLDEYPELEIGSVDGFQGREKEAAILSLVRSNSTKEVGFLNDYRRMNVAITRARRHLCVIGDSSTVSHGGPFLQAMFKHLKDKAVIRTPPAGTTNAA